MRVFVALELSPVIKDKLVGIQDEVRSLCPVGNYSGKDNFHVTLKFIGEIDPDKLGGIRACMDQVAKQTDSFDVGLNGLGFFRKGSRHVVWAGLSINSFLVELYSGIESCLVKDGYVRGDRSFSPHVTFGRNVLVENSSCLSGVVYDRIDFRVDSICLMESKRVDGILRYIPIYRSVFGGMRD